MTQKVFLFWGWKNLRKILRLGSLSLSPPHALYGLKFYRGLIEGMLFQRSQLKDLEIGFTA